MKSIGCVILYLALFSKTGLAQNVQNRLDGLLKEASEKKLFSGHVLVEQDGVISYQQAVGMADVEKKLPNTAETRFAIGSITKLFTRIMVLQLASEGKLSLQDPMGQYLSGFRPEIADHITIGHLLDHTAGFGQYYEAPGYDPEGATITCSTDFLPWIRTEQLAFEPGTRPEYSNSGYVLLGAIIEKVTGRNYAEALQIRVFDRVGMANSGFLFRIKKLPGKAIGYLSNQPGPLQDNLGIALFGGGDGGIYSSSSDLIQLTHSLIHDNRLLSDADKVRLVNEPLFPRQYGSWAEFQQSGRFALAGGAPGISAVLGINLEKKRAVVVLSNFDEGSAESLFQRIGAILNGEQPAPMQPSPAIFIYQLLLTKGAAYFSTHIEQELQQHGYDLGDDDMPLLFAGQPLLAEGKADEAIALYQFYTSKYPRIVVAWNDLGDAYLIKNDKANAKKCFQKALEIRPGNPRAKATLEKL